MQKPVVLITGIAGFIGYYLSKRLLSEGKFKIVGIDNLNAYYPVSLKEDRLRDLGLNLPETFDKSCAHEDLEFVHGSIEDRALVMDLFRRFEPTFVFNLAAQAGVRYSLEKPFAYSESNVTGFLTILEACRHHEIKHLIYASSSSVYGNNTKVPYSEEDPVEQPISLYAATKRSNELKGYTYSHLYGIPATGVRFFTVYGPWGRPDMAYFSFTKRIVNGEGIKVFGHGKPQRDFTYVDDIISGLTALMNKPPTADPVPHRLLNIGNHTPVSVMKFIETLENVIGREAEIEYLDMQPGDVMTTFADVSRIEKLTGFKPNTELRDGLVQFWNWFEKYYNVLSTAENQG